MVFQNFRDFMEHAVRKYYSSNRALKDFFTAPELDRAFGEALAEFFSKHLSEFDKPVLLELGAGRGLLARDILNYYRENYPQLFANIKYYIYEFSPYLIEKQKQVLQDFSNVEWVENLPKIEGIIFSNEFFDALPVHVIKGNKELYIDEKGNEIWLNVQDERINEYINRMGYNGLNQVLEVCLDCIDFLKKISESLIRGYHMVIDYGYTSEELPRFPEGTIVAYKDHKVIKDFTKESGSVDITAHVNFSALIEYGKDFGLETILFQTQRDFLMHIPTFLNELEKLSWEENAESVERLSRLKTMLVSMGDKFKVLLQRKLS
ncbi:MAG TPA: class I SAM-dependent methyltransferase [Aquifex aeolicus]|nr:class I SAM-dependent methyltransferase [Aquifex aeolicus]